MMVKAATGFLAIMQNEAGRMQRLIDDLLSLSRVEAEEHRPPNDAIAMIALLDELVSSMRDAAAEKRQNTDDQRGR